MTKKIFHILSLCSLLLFCHCNKMAKNSSVSKNESTGSTVTDTLRAATLYGPTSYFNYRGQTMGFDYENVKRFAEDEGMYLDLKVAPSLQALLKMVQEGEVDLAAYPVPHIEEYNKLVKHAGHKEVTWQVLVQPAGSKLVTDVTQLVGKTIYVEKDSKYHYRLQNLDKELGGGIDIVPISKDSLITEDLIRMVDQGEIPMTVVDSDIAELNKSYYPRLDIGMKISLDQYSSWAVRNDCDSLAVKIDNWEKKNDNSELLKSVYKKYFEISRNNSPEDGDTSFTLNVKNGVVSPYDATFKRHAHVAGYDWQLLAAIGYNESRFNNSVVSWAGAKGLMQLMPATARAMGISPESLQNPDANVLAAARLIKKLDTSLESKIPDKAERMKFVVAAYNCGLGHIYDAIALAGKYGLDPKVWTGSVSEAALMKSRPQYYNDPVVKNGYFRGRETTEFVERVMNAYNYYKNNTN